MKERDQHFAHNWVLLIGLAVTVLLAAGICTLYVSIMMASMEREGNHLQVVLILNAVILALFMALVTAMVFIQRKNSRKLEQLAFVDPVTGGMNRVRFEMEAIKRIQKAIGGTYVLVSVDVKRFKLINDGFGSREGNLTLRYMHGVFCRLLREGELAARISADTFDLLLEYTGREEIAARIDEMAEKINCFNEKRKNKYYLPLSAGAFIINDPELGFITIQDRANVARKKMKSTRFSLARLSSCVFYSDEERIRMIKEKEIDDRVDEALKNHEFLVFLQPKLELSSGRTAGAEALVRWQVPEKGFLSPAEFIPIMEKNGYIVSLDLYVFEQVCQLLRRWIERGQDPIPISVNLSRVHLDNPHFLDAYESLLQRYEVPPQLLEIELTETLVFENLKILSQVIERIHHIGMRCSLDDFGSGYSSLHMLSDVEVDVLKLDRAFFLGEQKNTVRRKSILQSVLEMAEKLRMQTVAEGVETQGQLQFLQKNRCDMVQGFVVSRPVPIDVFEKMVFDGEGGISGDQPVRQC